MTLKKGFDKCSFFVSSANETWLLPRSTFLYWCVHLKHIAEVGKFEQVNLKYVMFQKERCGILVKSISYNECVRLVED